MRLLRTVVGYAPRITVPAMLRIAAILVAVVVVGGGFGLVAGVGLDKISRTPPHDPLARVAKELAASARASSGAAGGGSNTATAAGSSASQTLSRAANGVRVHVMSAVMHPAGTASGKRRQRARVSMRVRVTNNRPATLSPVASSLVSGSEPVSGTAEAALKRKLASGQRASGRIRFETAGAVTQSINTTGEMNVLVAGVPLTVTVKVGTPVSRGAS